MFTECDTRKKWPNNERSVLYEMASDKIKIIAGRIYKKYCSLNKKLNISKLLAFLDKISFFI